jgi:hypothetical protein
MRLLLAILPSWQGAPGWARTLVLTALADEHRRAASGGGQRPEEIVDLPPED